MIRRLTIDIPSGYLSREAGSFVAQLDNLSERMGRDTQDLTPEELAWQPEPGMNTIGMLLAHIAIWEVFWMKRGVENDPEARVHVEDILGIPATADGIPLPEDGSPPAVMMQPYPFFAGLHDRARACTADVARRLSDHDMEREIEMVVPTGTRIVTPRWTLYHILEHQAGHYGQILLLKNMIRRRVVSAAQA